jgi:hypothetical protein
MVVALVALFVALSGSAVAATVVPLAKRALVADNAKKLGGRTPAQLIAASAALPSPARSAAGLVSVRTGPFSLNPDQGQAFTANCQTGERAVSGGYTYQGETVVLSVDTVPTSNGAGWQIYLINTSSTDSVSGTVVAVCMR